ncbi:hypothetical protein D3C78_733800 [compost metagenome]
MPLSGTARSCSLTALMLPARSVAGVSFTGKIEVNQPRVRVRSMSSNRSSRPWPSSLTRVED